MQAQVCYRDLQPTAGFNICSCQKARQILPRLATATRTSLPLTSSLPRSTDITMAEAEVQRHQEALPAAQLHLEGLRRCQQKPVHAQRRAQPQDACADSVVLKCTYCKKTGHINFAGINGCPMKYPCSVCGDADHNGTHHRKYGRRAKPDKSARQPSTSARTSTSAPRARPRVDPRARSARPRLHLERVCRIRRSQRLSVQFSRGSVQYYPGYKNPHFRPKSLGMMCGPPHFGELRVFTRGIRFTSVGAPRVLATTIFLARAHRTANFPKKNRLLFYL